jgi:hypothetical protein
MAHKTTQHAVIGTGSSGSTAVAIKECLLDVLDDTDVVGLVWKRPIPEALEWVYDFVIDNSVPFVMYYDEANTIPPKVFREAAHGSVQKSRNPELAAMKAISGSGKVLFLWDAAENEVSEDSLIGMVFDTIDPGTIVLELSNGLRPIRATEDQEEAPKGRYDDDEDIVELDSIIADLESATQAVPVYADVAPEDPPDKIDVEDMQTIGPFTRDELLNMPALMVKRYGKKIGAEATTKAGIIDELFPLDPIETTPPGVQIMEDAIEQNEEQKTIPEPEFDDPTYKAFRRNVKCLGGPSDVKEIFEDLVRAVIKRAPVSRERALAITALEEAHHWAVKAVILTGDLPEV